jgi:hypothetical protein
MTAGGLVRSIFATIQLTEERGEMCSIKGVACPTAAGYQRMNAIVGISFYSPDTLRGDDGRLAPNPMFRRAENGTTQSVTVRKLGMGRNAAGNLTIRDLTICYDLEAYRARDLYSKWRRGGKSADWGKLVPTDAPAEDGRLAVPINGQLALSVSLASPDVLDAVADDMHRRQFVERLANTICERNLLKAFTGISRLPRDCKVSLYGWSQADRDFAAVMRQASEAQQGEVVIDGETVKVEGQRADADPEEVDAEVDGAADETCPPPGEPVAAEPTPAPTAQSEKALAMVQRMRDIAENLDGGAFDDLVRQKLGYESWGTLAAETDETKLAAALQQFEAAVKPKEVEKPGKQATLPLQPQARRRA